MKIQESILREDRDEDTGKDGGEVKIVFMES